MPPKAAIICLDGAKEQQRTSCRRQAHICKRKAGGISKQRKSRQPVAPTGICAASHSRDQPKHHRAGDQSNRSEAGCINAGMFESSPAEQ